METGKKCKKHPYIFDLVSNGLQLDLKVTPLQRGNGSHLLSTKGRDIGNSIIIAKMKVIDGSIPKQGYFFQTFSLGTKRLQQKNDLKL